MPVTDHQALTQTRIGRLVVWTHLRDDKVATAALEKAGQPVLTDADARKALTLLKEEVEGTFMAVQLDEILALEQLPPEETFGLICAIAEYLEATAL